jgi:rhodanese-related sulfurtransferase
VSRGVKRISAQELAFARRHRRTLYQYDVRLPEDYAAGHLPGFRNAQGGNWCRKPTISPRARRAHRAGRRSWPRADMTASWLAQLGWEVYVGRRAVR